MSLIRRLDHVAIAVRDTDLALRTYQDALGLRVVHEEVLERLSVRLTYLDAGNAYIQLVEPLEPTVELSQWIDENGEGLHHICFGVDDPIAAAAEFAQDGSPPPVRGTGRGRISSFVPGELFHGVRVECTEFRREEDLILPKVS
jgi:methylmalonyl-CoA/ethylmalonyl-CoA epimerase